MSRKTDYETFVKAKNTHGVFVFKEGNKSRYIFPDDELPWWITKRDIPKWRILNRQERKKFQNMKMPYGDVQPKPNLKKRIQLFIYSLRIRLGVLQLMYFKWRDKKNKTDKP